MVTIDDDSVTVAYRKWRELTRSPANYNSWYKFMEEFLYSSRSRWYDENYLSEEGAAKVAWLNGPHAATIYKAWKAKHYG